MSMNEKNLVFIASGGRTGTTFFGEKLGQIIEDCHSSHEPEVLHRNDLLDGDKLRTFGVWEMLIGRLLGKTGTRVLGTRLLFDDIDFDTVAQRLRRSRARWHTQVEESLIVESNGPLWLVAHELDRIWPGAKLVGIVRDPRTWVRSFMNYEGRYDSRDPVDFFPPGRLTPAKLGQTDLAALWPEWGTFEKLAWEWTIINGRLIEAVDRQPNARLWRFEDLFNGQPDTAEELVDFVCDHGTRQYAHKPVSDFLGKRVNASRGAAKDWDSWTPDQARLVDELCGEQMARLGYGQEPEWKALLNG